MKSTETQIGEWVNVMGYITDNQKQNRIIDENSEISVQALVLWSAGPFNRTSYEKSLDQKTTDEMASRQTLRMVPDTTLKIQDRCD